jgi:UDP-N-acetylglucosamine--N-acetylmuramyl-(pentapeptide) pyrophosphoryl-undecaprenol N-acetylglucosamine transferase
VETARTDDVRPAYAPEPSLRYIGEAGGVEEGLAARAGVPFVAIATGQIRGRAPWVMARNLVRMARGAEQCAHIIREFRPDVVLMTGGYVAAPVAWAAWRAQPRVPALIYLPDVTPGQAIRLASLLADRVAVSFPEVTHYFPGKAVVTGYPIRPELHTVDKASARAALGLDPNRPVLLVFGGSRGARSINRALVAALPALLPQCQVVHISGQADWPWITEATHGRDSAHGPAIPEALRESYHAYPYLHEMAKALAAADLVVARAGAAVLGEFPALRLPSILAPYPYAGQHQEANARYLAERGAAAVLNDAELAEMLAPTILRLLAAPVELRAMADAAARLARPDAAERIARELCDLAGR